MQLQSPDISMAISSRPAGPLSNKRGFKLQLNSNVLLLTTTSQRSEGEKKIQKPHGSDIVGMSETDIAIIHPDLKNKVFRGGGQ
jgi:hypothetical protein